MQKINTKKLALLGAASGLGAQLHDTGKGPEALYQNNLIEALNRGQNLYWKESIYPSQETSLSQTEKVIDHAGKLAQAVEQTIINEEFPIVLGGDHAIAAGSWAGVIKAHQKQQDFGLIWVDAHMDAHTPETSPSQAYHGMPVAALLGYGDKAFTNIAGFTPKIRPEHLVQIGIRSYEEGEAKLLKDLGVKIYFIEEVKARGFATVYREAIEYLNKQTSLLGITIDLDAFDPEHAPGVGSPEANGILAHEALPYLNLLTKTNKLAAIEITEYNPSLDKNFKTAKLVSDILNQLMP